MDWLFPRLLDLSINHGGHLLVVVVVCLLLLSGMGLPLPEDIPLLFAGLLSSQGVLCLEIMIPLTFLAVVGADSILYFLGRTYGHHVPRLPLLRRFLSTARLERAQLAFHEHGGKTLFVARFLPGIRAPVFFTAGIFKIPYWKFLAFDGSAAAISVPLLVLIAYFGGQNLDKIRHMAKEAQISIAVAAGFMVLLVAIWQLRRRRKIAAAKSEPPRSTPAISPSGQSHT